MDTFFTRYDFRKASYSEPQQNCVSVAMAADVVEVRDEKTTFGAADDGRLRLRPTAFAAFTTFLSSAESVAR